MYRWSKAAYTAFLIDMSWHYFLPIAMKELYFSVGNVVHWMLACDVHACIDRFKFNFTCYWVSVIRFLYVQQCCSSVVLSVSCVYSVLLHSLLPCLCSVFFDESLRDWLIMTIAFLCKLYTSTTAGELTMLILSISVTFSVTCLTVKDTFHYSSQLQTWLQTRFSTRFAASFSTSSCGFATCFRLFFVENLVASLLHQSRHVEINAASQWRSQRGGGWKVQTPFASKPFFTAIKLLLLNIITSL